MIKIKEWLHNLGKTNLLDEIKQLKQNKDLLMFLVFLFVSASFWLLNALRDDYVASFDVPVRFVNVPENQVLVQTDDQAIQIKVKGSGFSILRQYLSSSFTPPSFDVSRLRRPSNDDNGQAFLLTQEQYNHFSGQLYLGMELVDLSPDTIFVGVQNLETRKVPVIFNGDIQLEKQFLLSGPVVFDPDSVEVTGPESLIDTLLAVPTKYMVYEKVRDSLKQNVSLLHPGGLRLSNKSTSMLIPVEPFSESSIMVPIHVIGLADSLRGKTFPSEVKVTFRTGISKFEKISVADFRATVDAGTVFSGDRPSRLKVKIEKMPQDIHSMDYAPIFVEYLIEQKR